MKIASCLAGLLAALVLVTPARAVDEDRVKEAIRRGVAALRTFQRQDDYFFHHQGPPGATALAGIALLEAGVSPHDPQVERAANRVRKSVADLTQTYSISMSIVFLDLLHDARDDYLIQILALRLLRGQQIDGSWGYECGPLSDEQKHTVSLRVHEAQSREAAPIPEGTTSAPSSLPEDIREGLKALQSRQRINNRPDNSNTQFAVLALWVARRRGIPAEEALVEAQRHFERTQLADGGWTYITPVNLVNTPAIPGCTCAGLIGLAIGHVSRRVVLHSRGQTASEEAGVTISRDPHVHAALLNLSLSIGMPVPQKIKLDPNNRNQKYLYCVLWSIERVAMAYGVKTIGGKDWYGWGAEMLLGSQEEDGSWRGDLPEGGVDTSFALLFLLRSNLVRDLSSAIKGHIKDEKVTMRAKPTTETPGIHLGPSPSAVSEKLSELAKALMNAPEAGQADLIVKYRDAKGGEYTQALAEAIHVLDDDLKRKARDALAERLTRMSADTLRRELGEDDAEIRGAAALACGMKDDKSFVPDLIVRLYDKNSRVERAAYESLKSITGRDYGPSSNATPEERTRAVIRWRVWWAQNQNKR